MRLHGLDVSREPNQIATVHEQAPPSVCHGSRFLLDRYRVVPVPICLHTVDSVHGRRELGDETRRGVPGWI